MFVFYILIFSVCGVLTGIHTIPLQFRYHYSTLFKKCFFLSYLQYNHIKWNRIELLIIIIIIIYYYFYYNNLFYFYFENFLNEYCFSNYYLNVLYKFKIIGLVFCTHQSISSFLRCSEKQPCFINFPHFNFGLNQKSLIIFLFIIICLRDFIYNQKVLKYLFTKII